MNIIFSEYRKNYTTYTFGYAVYAMPDSLDEYEDVYAKGFLPYTGDTTLRNPMFYMARSFRINLSRYVESSENRRVNRKAEPFAMTLDIIAKESFDLTDTAFIDFCTNYAEERFSGGSMSRERLLYVLYHPNCTHIAIARSNERIMGYIVLGIHGAGTAKSCMQYWFAFFDTSLMEHFPVGKWMMGSVIRHAKEQSMAFVYLGTCYTEKALYKTRDFSGGECFIGNMWSPDMELLKTLCKRDSADTDIESDLFKDPAFSSAHSMYRSEQ